ncbi:hypothetical protein FXW78_51550 [Rhodococcus opacus]|nr:hypothetical protein [Rhodococcus opacus]
MESGKGLRDGNTRSTGTPYRRLTCRDRGDRRTEQRHQPGPILTGPLAAPTETGSLPESILRWLTDASWDTAPALRCPDHATL